MTSVRHVCALLLSLTLRWRIKLIPLSLTLRSITHQWMWTSSVEDLSQSWAMLILPIRIPDVAVAQHSRLVDSCRHGLRNPLKSTSRVQEPAICSSVSQVMPTWNPGRALGYFKVKLELG